MAAPFREVALNMVYEEKNQGFAFVPARSRSKVSN